MSDCSHRVCVTERHTAPFVLQRCQRLLKRSAFTFLPSLEPVFHKSTFFILVFMPSWLFTGEQCELAVRILCDITKGLLRSLSPGSQLAGSGLIIEVIHLAKNATFKFTGHGHSPILLLAFFLLKQTHTLIHTCILACALSHNTELFVSTKLDDVSSSLSLTDTVLCLSMGAEDTVSSKN